MSTTVQAADRAARAGPPTGVRLDRVSFAYPGRGERAIEAIGEITLTAAPGDIVALVGPSGCGKTTLLELVCGLLEPSQGTISAPGAVLMPQNDLLLPWLSALDNAALALRIKGRPRQAARAAAMPLLTEFGLAGFERSRPYELSGGMRQRVAFLRTLLSGKPVLCLDEPFASLDALTRADMGDWLGASLTREPRTTLLVTDDVEEACVLADHIVVLSPRPARVRGVIEVRLPRPRSRTDAALVDLRRRALELLGI